MVGHIHLSINVYEDIYEIVASLGMNIIVAIGFFIDYKNSREMAYKKKGASKIVKNYKAQKQKEKEDKEASINEAKKNTVD